MLCELAFSEKDKKLIRVTAMRNIFAAKSKKVLGISNLVKKREAVAEAVQQYRDIQEAMTRLFLLERGWLFRG